MDTMTHEAPAMFLADMPTTDEGTADFRRLAVRPVGQRLNAAMEMAAERLGGRAPERLPRAQAQDPPRHREDGYFPNEVLRPYSRTDRAMVGTTAEVYKLGLSTRKIERPPSTSIQCLESAAPPRIPSAAPCRRIIMLQTHLYCISSDGSADA